MSLDAVLRRLLSQARMSRPSPATLTLDSGLEVVVRVDPPRLILHRTATDDGKNTFRRDDPRAEQEGETCARHLGWIPWLTWNTHDGEDYLVVCDMRLRAGLIGTISPTAQDLRAEAEQDGPRTMFQRLAPEPWYGLDHSQLRSLMGV